MIGVVVYNSYALMVDQQGEACGRVIAETNNQLSHYYQLSANSHIIPDVCVFVLFAEFCMKATRFGVLVH
jgi:hypothetical protein